MHNQPRLIVLTLCFVLVSGTATAATITVTTDQDTDATDSACSLREAIIAANDDLPYRDCPTGTGADRIVFDLTLPATIVLTDHLPTITDALKISGPGIGQLILNGDELYRPITLDSPGGDTWLAVEDLTLAYGRSPVGDFGGGGARTAPGETAHFRRVHFFANRAENAGGGLIVEGSGTLETFVTLRECWFESNIAEGPAGGGGLIAAGGTGHTVVDIFGSAFVGNHAESSGGGMRMSRSTFTLEASTLSGNTANDSGAGIYASTDPFAATTLVIRDTTITDNTAGADLGSGDGGGLLASPGPDHPLHLTVENSAIADNFDLAGAANPDIECGPNLTSLTASGSSFISANEGCATLFPAGSPNTNGDFVGTAAVPLNPRLEVLGNHGGVTPVHRPLRNPLSPLIDQGNCPEAVTDQRGYGTPTTGLRPMNLPNVPDAVGGDACDIGAVEARAEEGTDLMLFSDGFESGHTLVWSSEVP